MNYKYFSFLMLSTALLATPEVQTFSEVFSEAKTSGNIKYYYIQTDKDFDSAPSTSADANSVGGQLRFDTASFYGFRAGATFMTTNPFLLGDSVDTSIIGKDNGVRGADATKGFSVLGEGYIAYKYKDLDLLYGRDVIKTPLINAKEVRMLPSAVEGAFARYDLSKSSQATVAYLDKFKQRTSSEFIDIVNHALGRETEAITGSTTGSVLMAGFEQKGEQYSFKLYDYYAADFLNSLSVDGTYKMSIAGMKTAFSGEYIYQKSVGNAQDNLAETASVTAGKTIEVNALSLRAKLLHKSAAFTVAYSNVLKNSSKHDSLVLPWDGTPLYTNMITSNDLFQSLYGSALKADSIYIGGSQGVKIAYKQKLDSFGLQGVSAYVAFLNTSNSKFEKDQRDYNIVLAYKYAKAFSFALKGIWVENNSGASADGTVSQIKLLSQYRVIANYKF